MDLVNYDFFEDQTSKYMYEPFFEVLMNLSDKKRMLQIGIDMLRNVSITGTTSLCIIGQGLSFLTSPIYDNNTTSLLLCKLHSNSA